MNYDKFGQKTNPLDKSGRISRCVICKSIYHWAIDCTNKRQDTSDDINITLFSQEMHEFYITKFTGETLNCAVLDVVNMLNQKINTVFTASANYVVTISKTNQLVEELDKRNKANVYLSINKLAKKSYNENVAIANKLHRQFRHSTSEKLKKLIKSSNIDDRELLEIIDTIDNKCQICMKYKKIKFRPSVGYSLSKDFNVVAVDLNPTNGVHLLHSIDHATRFSPAAVAKVVKLIRQWWGNY